MVVSLSVTASFAGAVGRHAGKTSDDWTHRHHRLVIQVTGSVLVVQPFVLAQGVQQVVLLPVKVRSSNS
jgi:hypothetical protein